MVARDIAQTYRASSSNNQANEEEVNEALSELSNYTPDLSSPGASSTTKVSRNRGCIATKLTVSEWADKNRRLSSETSSEPGQWRTDRGIFKKE